MRTALVATLLVLILLFPVAAHAATATDDGPYVARSLWTAKHVGGLDRLYFMLREPWLARPTGEGVVVAIVDTGIDADHPDLAGSVVGWRDFVNERTRPYDDHGHGTHVAAIVAGRGHLQLSPFSSYWLTGERGVAPGAKLLVAKAMDAKGMGDDVKVAKAIRWAMDPNGDGDPADGAHVISLSVGLDGPPGFYDSGPSVRAVLEAIRAGIVVVVASGNDGEDRVTPPGNAPGAIVVGAVTGDGDVAGFSNWGPELDLVAPGILVSAYPRDLDRGDIFADGYTGMGGTSMAAPFVAGVVALMLEADPALARTSFREDLSRKVALVEHVLKSTARPLGTPRAGAGLLDAHGAVAAVDKGTDVLDPAFAGAVASALAVLAFGGWRARRRLRVRVPVRA